MAKAFDSGLFSIHNDFSLQTKQLNQISRPPRATLQPGSTNVIRTPNQRQPHQRCQIHRPHKPAGKLASSRNSLVHGLLSEAIILDGESASRFNALHDALIEEYQPETATEVGLVETMVVCRWRLMRTWILENSAVAHEMRKQAEANALENMPTQAALAHRTLTDHSRQLDVFNRYEARFDRQLSRTIQRFIEARNRRKRKK